jgi:hypothetical protein
MNKCSDKSLTANTSQFYSIRMTNLALWLFLNHPEVLTEETREGLHLTQEAEKETKIRRTKSPFSTGMRRCCTELLNKFIPNSKSLINLGGPKRITLELIKEYVETQAMGPKSKHRRYIDIKAGIGWLHRLEGLDWEKSELFRDFTDFIRNSRKTVVPSIKETEMILKRKKRKWTPLSKPLDEAARNHNIYNQIDRSYTVECVAASHGPTHVPYTNHFTQASFSVRSNVPPKPSFLDFIAKCGSMKLDSSQSKNPEMSSIYQRMEQTMDETALVALGIMAEECLVASMLPLARSYVDLCREKDVALHSLARDDPQNDEGSYNLKSFAHWTKPCEEAIVELASRSNEKNSAIPILPSTRPADLTAKEPSKLSFTVPSISKILGKPFQIEERLLEEAAEREWFAKQSTASALDKELRCLFSKAGSNEKDTSHLNQVASALEALERNDSRLAMDLNLPIPRIIKHSSEPALYGDDVEI